MTFHMNMELAKLRQEEILHDAQPMHIDLGSFHDEEQELLALERERVMAEELRAELEAEAADGERELVAA